MPVKRLLLLGGTEESRVLAERLMNNPHFEIITSLAGRTSARHPIAGFIRIGGFGGIDGLMDYIRQHEIHGVVDATHPFAAIISHNAFIACRQIKCPYFCLQRPPWKPIDDDHWLHATNADEAARLPKPGATVLLTIGHKDLASFFERDDLTIILRTIELPVITLPSTVTFIKARPPFTLQEEFSLFEDYKITHLVSKNSGGDQTKAKLAAARQYHASIIMIERPPHSPPTDATTVDDMISLLKTI